METKNQIKFFKIRAEAQQVECKNCKNMTYHEIELYFAHENRSWALMLKAQCWKCKNIVEQEFKQV